MAAKDPSPTSLGAAAFSTSTEFPHCLLSETWKKVKFFGWRSGKAKVNNFKYNDDYLLSQKMCIDQYSNWTTTQISNVYSCFCKRGQQFRPSHTRMPCFMYPPLVFFQWHSTGTCSFLSTAWPIINKQCVIHMFMVWYWLRLISGSSYTDVWNYIKRFKTYN